MELLNPDFEYVFFDDTDMDAFVASEFREYSPIYNAFSFRIQRVDFFRYLAIYHFGGFYFDLDVLLSSSLSPLLDLECVFPFEALAMNRFLRERYEMDWEIGNYGFGAAPRHPFVGALIENCVRGQKEPEWVESMMKEVPGPFRSRYYVLCTTGPRMVSRTLAEHLELAHGVSVLFPDDVCDAGNWNLLGDTGPT